MYLLVSYDCDCDREVFGYHSSEKVLEKFISKCEDLKRELSILNKEIVNTLMDHNKIVDKIVSDRAKISSEVKSMTASLKYLTDKEEMNAKIKELKEEIEYRDKQISELKTDRDRIGKEKREDIIKKYPKSVVEFCDENSDYLVSRLYISEVKELKIQDITEDD